MCYIYEKIKDIKFEVYMVDLIVTRLDDTHYKEMWLQAQ